MIGLRVRYRVKVVVRDSGPYHLTIRHVANMDGWCQKMSDVRFSFPILGIDQGCLGS